MKKLSVLSVTSFAVLSVVMTCGSVGVFAAGDVLLSRPASRDGTVEIENIAGTIAVQGWGRDEVRVEGYIGEGSRDLEFDGDGETTRIIVELEENEDVEGSELEIMVPRGSRVRIATVSAEVEVEDVDGELEIETVAGDIDIEGSPEVVALTSVSGDIDVSLESALRRARVKTVVGDIDIETRIGRDGRLELESVSGDIDLFLPGDVSATFDVSTFSGDIESDLGGQVRRRNEYLPAKELRFSVGGGDARVVIETHTGVIDISSDE